MVRIHFPPAESQVRTCLSREFAFLRREAAVSAGVRAGASGAVGRDAPDAATAGLTGGKYLCRAIFQYRTAGDVGSLTIAVVLSSDRAQAKPSAVR